MAALQNQLLALTTSNSGPVFSSAYAVDGSVFHSTPSWQISFEVRSLTTGTPLFPAYVRFGIQDTVDGVNWSTACCFELSGQTGVSYPINRAFTMKDAPGLRLRQSGAQLRVGILLFQGTPANCTWQSTWTGVLSN